MTRFLLRRAGLAVLVLFAVVTLTFFVLHASGDPIGVALQGSGASDADVARIKHELGYDRPLPVQYVDYLGGIVRGNFGASLQYGQDSMGLVLQRLPYTLLLAGAALLVTALVALPLGILAGRRRGGVADRIAGFLAALGQSVPPFVTGPILILVFAVALPWFPVSGAGSAGSLVLPAITLALFPLSRVVRLLRSGMLEAGTAEHVSTARAKGLRERAVVLRHVFRNALLPVLTVIAVQITQMLGGAVVVEAVFGWPGIGSFARDALINSDFPLAQTIVVVTAAGVVLINLVTDLGYSLIDPRIRLR
ncbi:ABC transporter permease [Amycolatopsis jejuensis]|uniref:ABC transporter permease n=1 Tax=Amycolatopsis jejuensis TaxID=330084 RepID=UPI00069155DB|nr:ABC transporter permease [Amycolatopsis jejuensis]